APALRVLRARHAVASRRRALLFKTDPMAPAFVPSVAFCKTTPNAAPAAAARDTLPLGLSSANAASTTSLGELRSEASPMQPSTAATSGSTGKQSTAEAHAPQADRAADLTQHERVRLVQRISRSFARLGPTGGSINIKLHPPQLGALNVQVRMEGRSMTAKLSTESAAARDAILDSLPVLRGRLADQGFEIANFQVEVADNNADAANSGNQQETPFGQPGQSGSGQRSPVDYRRLAAQGRRHQSELAAGGPPGTVHLSPTSLASLDLQA
ncbi:MAG: flagellar hook-length control protein FliK, partial [Planctomycetales bacterium]|nr:flagellar hook-length control protein FliK [Planctomycetales bacterium]